VNQGSLRQPVRLDRWNAPPDSAAAEISGQTTRTTEEYPRIVGTCVVTSAADSGEGTLRWCLENVESGTTITFDTSVFPPPRPVSITLASPLPTILQGNITIDASDAGVILDGSAMSDADYPYGNGLELMSDGNIVRGLQILRFPAHGVSIADCKNNVIGGDRAQGQGQMGQGNVISGNGGSGVDLGGSNAMSNTVIGNLIGTDASGMNVVSNESQGVFFCLGASNNRIGGMDPRDRNIISGNHNAGVTVMRGAHSNLIIGNYVGTDISGTTALGNRYGGVTVELGGFHNRIEGNLISGNEGAGIYIGDWGSDYNVVVGNLVGTDAAGTKVLGGGGVGIGSPSGGSFNRIGGTRPGERNVISGNGIGVGVGGPGCIGNLVLGNFIGTDITGMQPLGNVAEGVGLGVSGRTLVGGTTPAERNIISGNGREGIEVQQSYSCVLGNYIGTDVSGKVALGNRWIGIGVGVGQCGAEHNVIQGNLIAHTTFSFSEQEIGGVGIWVDSYPYNTIRGNSIYGNAGKGIVTSNGGNNMLASPVISTVTETSVSGTACPGCTVEIFSDAEDEGRVYEESAIADGNGNWTWTGSLSGPYVTATATDEAGNTSAFSAPQIAWRHGVYLPLVLREKD